MRWGYKNTVIRKDCTYKSTLYGRQFVGSPVHITQVKITRVSIDTPVQKSKKICKRGGYQVQIFRLYMRDDFHKDLPEVLWLICYK